MRKSGKMRKSALSKPRNMESTDDGNINFRNTTANVFITYKHLFKMYVVFDVCVAC